MYMSLSLPEIVSGELALVVDTGPWELEPSEIYIYIYIICTYLSLPEIVSGELALVVDTGPWELEPSEIYIYISYVHISLSLK